MKIRHIILICMVLLSFSSCEKDDDYTIVLKESGNLKAQLTQNEIPISDQKVYLINGYPNFEYGVSIPQIAIDYGVTDANGFIDFGEVNAGNYTVIAEEVDVNEKLYKPYRYFQLVSGANKSVSMEILDFVGTFDITFINYDDNPIQGLNALIVTYEDYYEYYNYYNDLNEIISRAIETKTSDFSGKVSFELPSGTGYVLIAYGTDKNGNERRDSWTMGTLGMDQEMERTYYMYGF